MFGQSVVPDGFLAILFFGHSERSDQNLFKAIDSSRRHPWLDSYEYF